MMKAVNSEARPIHGLAKDVELRLGGWVGKVSMYAIPMEYFLVVLGLEFLNTAKAIPMPFLGTLCIMDEKLPVPVIHTGKAKEEMVSALQLVKGFNKGEATHLATVMEEEAGTIDEPLPQEIAKVLDEFKGVMQKELPKRLPPRRKVDHHIELEPRAKPPAMVPYRVAPPELEE